MEESECTDDGDDDVSGRLDSPLDRSPDAGYEVGLDHDFGLQLACGEDGSGAG